MMYRPACTGSTRLVLGAECGWTLAKRSRTPLRGSIAPLRDIDVLAAHSSAAGIASDICCEDEPALEDRA